MPRSVQARPPRAAPTPSSRSHASCARTLAYTVAPPFAPSLLQIRHRWSDLRHLCSLRPQRPGARNKGWSQGCCPALCLEWRRRPVLCSLPGSTTAACSLLSAAAAWSRGWWWQADEEEGHNGLFTLHIDMIVKIAKHLDFFMLRFFGPHLIGKSCSDYTRVSEELKQTWPMAQMRKSRNLRGFCLK